MTTERRPLGTGPTTPADSEPTGRRLQPAALGEQHMLPANGEELHDEPSEPGRRRLGGGGTR